MWKQSVRQQLSTIIDNQFAASLTANTALNASFQVRSILTILKCLPLMMYCNKCSLHQTIDMMQALNITIDYVDGDGD
jgi:hypothetical protein